MEKQLGVNEQGLDEEERAKLMQATPAASRAAHPLTIPSLQACPSSRFVQACHKRHDAFTR